MIAGPFGLPRASVFALAFVLAACGESPLPETMATPSDTAPPTEPPSSAFKTLARAHAHNDYDHTRPLLDALDQGFTSVEADVYTDPVVGMAGLYVAHEVQGIRPDRTFQSLYLEPLKARVAAHHGCVHDDCSPFYLLIDNKTDAELTYAAIESALADYDALFTRVDKGVLRPGPITAILSGNRPLATMKAKASRYCFYDGRFADLDTAEPATLIPLISDSWTDQFTWTGEGAMPAAEHAKLADAIARAHAKGRRVRIYNAPDAAGAARNAVWSEMLADDQDQINTDDLSGLRAFLLANDPDLR